MQTLPFRTVFFWFVRSQKKSLINLDQSKGFDRMDYGFVGSWVRAKLLQLNSPFVRVSQSHGRGERGKIETLFFVSINSSRLCARSVRHGLFALVHAVRLCVGTFFGS